MKLARKILKNCAKILMRLKETINSKDFLYRHRKSETHFIRNATLTFPILIFFLMNLLKSSLQRELNQFFNLDAGLPVAKNTIVKSAFTKARKKFSYTAFIELNEQLIKETEQVFPLKKWNGLRLIAIDGSTIKVPNSKEILAHFGVQKSGTKKEPPMARISQSFDVLNKISLDTCISPIEATDELTAAYHHLYKATNNDLFLFDRGYPAFWLFFVILHHHSNFCARVKVGWSNATQEFYKSGKRDQILEILPPYASKRTLLELNYQAKPLKVRFVRVKLDSGETEILITSLLDQKKFPTSLFKGLYFHRWPIEEDYKTMKYRLELGNFSGKTVEAVYQDFHAKILSKNITTILSLPTQKIIDRNTSSRKFNYKSNFTEALSNMKNAIVCMFKSADPFLLIKTFQRLVITIIEPIRKGRSYERKRGFRRREFHTNYKSIL